MTDIWTNDNDNSDNEKSDQHEIECYLYSLVHHGSIEEECQQETSENTQPLEDDDLTPATQKTWRYFNTASSKKNFITSKHFKQSSEQYKCTYYRTNRFNGQKIFSWRQHLSQSILHRKSVATMNYLNDKAVEKPQVICQNSVNSANHGGAAEVICIDDSEKNSIHDMHCTPSSGDKPHLDIMKPSSSIEDTLIENHSSPSPSKENLENTNDKMTQVCFQEDKIDDVLNTTNHSLTSNDDCFEAPLVPKSKSALHESMTEVLQAMLDEDASRSSVESSDKRPPQKSKVSSKSVNGWSIGMAWEDMSSKFRFEVDSVCGDSVREGSVSASSRAVTPDIGVSTSPQDVSKYDASLKCKDNPDAVDIDVNSDSDAESVVEVVKPEKDPPPIVEILSDSEDIIPTKIKKLDKLPKIEEEIVILYETVAPDKNDNCAEGSLSPFLINPLASRQAIAAGPSKKKERSRKKARQGKSAMGAKPDHGLGSILATMSDDPKLWRICKEDIYPRPAGRKFRPCDNCKQRDHFTWHCPEPRKIKVCQMCAEPGHASPQCPNRMCLNCGSLSWQFLKDCPVCPKKKLCEICSLKGHETQQCPDLWRRYHLTTSKGSPVEPPRDLEVRSPSEMWCCNCSKKGHISDSCPAKTSSMNEKRVSYVVSYTDPINGREHTDDQLVANTPMVSGQEALCKKRRLISSKTASSPNTPEVQSGTECSLGVMANIFDTIEFRRNYKKFGSRLHAVGEFPVDPLALANYLEAMLERLKNPVLNDAKVRMCYSYLVKVMKQDKITKQCIRKAIKFASQINMTVIGFGGLGEGNVLVDDLKEKIRLLRLLRTTKVPYKMRSLINETFAQLFKGSIRKDLGLLVMEYLKRKNKASS